MAQLKHGDVKGKILTVNGLIEPHDLGKTICHEHLFIDFRVVYQDPPLKKDYKKSIRGMYSYGTTKNMNKIDEGFKHWEDGTIITCKLDLDEGTFKMYQDDN